jgi:hypothetical protein
MTDIIKAHDPDTLTLEGTDATSRIANIDSEEIGTDKGDYQAEQTQFLKGLPARQEVSGKDFAGRNISEVYIQTPHGEVNYGTLALLGNYADYHNNWSGTGSKENQKDQQAFWKGEESFDQQEPEVISPEDRANAEGLLKWYKDAEDKYKTGELDKINYLDILGQTMTGKNKDLIIKYERFNNQYGKKIYASEEVREAKKQDIRTARGNAEVRPGKENTWEDTLHGLKKIVKVDLDNDGTNIEAVNQSLSPLYNIRLHAAKAAARKDKEKLDIDWDLATEHLSQEQKEVIENSREESDKYALMQLQDIENENTREKIEGKLPLLNSLGLMAIGTVLNPANLVLGEVSGGLLKGAGALTKLAIGKAGIKAPSIAGKILSNKIVQGAEHGAGFMATAGALEFAQEHQDIENYTNEIKIGAVLGAGFSGIAGLGKFGLDKWAKVKSEKKIALNVLQEKADKAQMDREQAEIAKEVAKENMKVLKEELKAKKEARDAKKVPEEKAPIPDLATPEDLPKIPETEEIPKTPDIENPVYTEEVAIADAVTEEIHTVELLPEEKVETVTTEENYESDLDAAVEASKLQEAKVNELKTSEEINLGSPEHVAELQSQMEILKGLRKKVGELTQERHVNRPDAQDSWTKEPDVYEQELIAGTNAPEGEYTLGARGNFRTEEGVNKAIEKIKEGNPEAEIVVADIKASTLLNPSKRILIKTKPVETPLEEVIAPVVHEPEMKVEKEVKTEGTLETWKIPEGATTGPKSQVYKVLDWLNKLGDIDHPLIPGHRLGKIEMKDWDKFLESFMKTNKELKVYMENYKKGLVPIEDVYQTFARFFGNNKREMIAPGTALRTQSGRLLSNTLKKYNDFVDSGLETPSPRVRLEPFKRIEKFFHPVEELNYDKYLFGEAPESLGLQGKLNNAQKDYEAILENWEGKENSVRSMREEAKEARETIEQFTEDNESVRKAIKNLDRHATSLERSANALETELERLAGKLWSNIKLSENLEVIRNEYIDKIASLKNKIDATDLKDDLTGSISKEADAWKHELFQMRYELSEIDHQITQMTAAKTTIPFKNEQPKTAPEILKEMYDSSTEESRRLEVILKEHKTLQRKLKDKKPTAPSEEYTKTLEDSGNLDSPKFTEWLKTKIKEAESKGNTPEARKAARQEIQERTLKELDLKEVPKKWERKDWLIEKKKVTLEKQKDGTFNSEEPTKEMFDIYMERTSEKVPYEDWIQGTLDKPPQNPLWEKYLEKYKALEKEYELLKPTKKAKDISKTYKLSNMEHREEINKVGQLRETMIEKEREISDFEEHDAATAMKMGQSEKISPEMEKFFEENSEVVETLLTSDKKISRRELEEVLTGDQAQGIKKYLYSLERDEHIKKWVDNRIKKHIEKISKDKDLLREELNNPETRRLNAPDEKTLKQLKKDFKHEVTDQDVIDYLEKELIERKRTYQDKKYIKDATQESNSVLPNYNVAERHSVMFDRGEKLIESLKDMEVVLKEKNESLIPKTKEMRIGDWETVADRVVTHVTKTPKKHLLSVEDLQAVNLSLQKKVKKTQAILKRQEATRKTTDKPKTMLEDIQKSPDEVLAEWSDKVSKQKKLVSKEEITVDELVDVVSDILRYKQKEDLLITTYEKPPCQ